jgi:uncharacterized protein
MDIEFTWRPEKAKRNLVKHKVRFETARQVFADPYVLIGEDERGEMRYHAIGHAGVKLLQLVFADRSTEDREIIHIISARKADKYEQSAYADQF